MPSFLSPVFGAGAQLFDNQGRILAGGKIYTYIGGTTTPTATFTDNTDLITNPNPIILDSAGRVPNEIWLEEGQATKFVLTDSTNNILGTWDMVAGVNDITTFSTTTEWSNIAATPSFISSTSFSVPGNLTSTLTVNRRLMLSVTAGTIYAYIKTSSFGSGITTVTVQPDSTVIDAGISQVMVGLLQAVNPSVPQQYLAANAPVTVASASTTPIGAALSINVIVSGVVTITAFDNVLTGIIRLVKFTGALTLTNNGTSLILPGAANITTVAGDQAIFRSLGSGNWECISYQHLANAPGFDPGTRMPFNQTAAPTGWTKDTTAALNDTAIRIVTGTVGSGGSVAFSSATVTATGNMGGTTDGHALSVAELAAHEHQEQATSSPGGGPTSPVRVAGSGGLGFSTIFIDSVGSNVTNSTPLNTTTVGSGTAHTHPLSGSATFTGNAIALNLKYNDFIIATKN